MKKGPLNPKYIRIEVRIGPLTGKTSRIGQVIGMYKGQNTSSRPRQNYRDSSSQGNFRGYERQIVEVDIEMMDIMITIEAETGQEKEYLQEIIIVAEIEVQVTVDPGQAPELIQTEIG